MPFECSPCMSPADSRDSARACASCLAPRRKRPAPGEAVDRYLHMYLETAPRAHAHAHTHALVSPPPYLSATPWSSSELGRSSNSCHGSLAPLLSSRFHLVRSHTVSYLLRLVISPHIIPEVLDSSVKPLIESGCSLQCRVQGPGFRWARVSVLRSRGFAVRRPRV